MTQEVLSVTWQEQGSKKRINSFCNISWSAREKQKMKTEGVVVWLVVLIAPSVRASDGMMSSVASLDALGMSMYGSCTSTCGLLGLVLKRCVGRVAMSLTLLHGFQRPNPSWQTSTLYECTYNG